MFEGFDEIKDVGIVEGAVYECFERLEVFGTVVQNEFMRTLIHPLHKSVSVAYDGGTLSPGDSGCQEAGYFNVLLFAEAAGYGNGIAFDEGEAVVLDVFFVEEGFEFGGVQMVSIRGNR